MDNKKIAGSINSEFKKDIYDKFLQAIDEYKLIENGDRIAVCISGGKDSMLLAKCMQQLAKDKIYNFETVFLVMDPGYNEVNRFAIERNAETLQIPLVIFESSIFDIVDGIERSPCYLCARMRRGHLYKNAKERGCNKIALGHHYDDVVETTLMGVLYNGQVQTMMPKLMADNYKDMQLIRPLYRVKEKDIIAWRDYNRLQFIQCACRFTENREGEENTSARREMKELIAELKKYGNIDDNIFNSMYDVNLNEIISYKANGIKYNTIK